MSAAALTLGAFLALAARPECGGSQGVEPTRLAAIAQGESALDPLAINVNGPRGGSVRVTTQDEAVKTATALITAGNSVDLGLMQINSANLARHGLTVARAFDACANLAAGAAHIAADFEAAWRAAHCRYNTGRENCANGYPERVERARQGIVRTVAGTQPAPIPPAAIPPAQSWDVWEREDDEQPRTVAPAPAPSPAPAPTSPQTAPGITGPVALQAVEIE